MVIISKNLWHNEWVVYYIIFIQRQKHLKYNLDPMIKQIVKKIRSTMKVDNVKMFLVTQLAQSGHTSIDPVSGWFLGRKFDHHDEVRRMTGGTESTASGTGFVDWTGIGWAADDLVTTARLDPDLQKVVKEKTDTGKDRG